MELANLGRVRDTFLTDALNDRMELFLDNARYYVNSKNNLIAMDDANKLIVCVSNNNNSVISGNNIKLSFAEYDMLQIIDINLTTTEALDVLDRTGLFTLEDIFRVKLYNKVFVDKVEATTALAAILTITDERREIYTNEILKKYN